jgi:hypothetical protein
LLDKVVNGFLDKNVTTVPKPKKGVSVKARTEGVRIRTSFSPSPGQGEAEEDDQIWWTWNEKLLGFPAW